MTRALVVVLAACSSVSPPEKLEQPAPMYATEPPPDVVVPQPITVRLFPPTW